MVCPQIKTPYKTQGGDIIVPVLGFIWLGVALIAGKLTRMAIPVLQRWFIPSSIIGGLLALLVGPEILGRILPLDGGLIGQDVIDFLRTLPGFLINIVFATLFLGKTIPSVKEIIRRAGPQVAFGQTVAWGQYVFGILLTLLVLTPLFGVEPMFGALIEIGFEGGHGTAAGLGSTFAEIGWEQGQDLALAMATVGIVTGVIMGMALINWGVARGHTKFVRTTHKTESNIQDTDEEDCSALQDTPSPGKVGIESIEPLAFHLAYIAVSIGIGYLLLQGLILLENTLLIPHGAPVLLGHIPLFPLAMIGGVIVQIVHRRFFPFLGLSREMIVSIQGAALDLLILSALGTLTISALADNWAPLLMLIIVGLAWSLGAFLFLARRMLPDYWFERAIGDYGQSQGVTATGLLLMRIVDPEAKSPAFEAFGYKQLLFEPFVGGGFFTAISVPLLFNFGAPLVLLITGGLGLFWLLMGLFYFGKKTATISCRE